MLLSSHTQKRRCEKGTKSNSESSRSHLLFTIHFIVENESNPLMNRASKLHICDLAGSERLAKSGKQLGKQIYLVSSLSFSGFHISNVKIDSNTNTGESFERGTIYQ